MGGYNTHTEVVLKLFYRTTLRSGETVIDNKDTTIAKELGITVGVVNGILQREMKNRINKLKSKK